jgi:hypothetical protein
MIDEWQIGKDLEGCILILVEVTPKHLPGVGEENHQQPLSGQVRAQSIFKPHICTQLYVICVTAAQSINRCNSIFGRVHVRWHLHSLHFFLCSSQSFVYLNSLCLPNLSLTSFFKPLSNQEDFNFQQHCCEKFQSHSPATVHM